MDPEDEFKRIEEIIKGISKAIEDETIYSISIDPCVKRNLVNSVSYDSNYKKSFDGYLRRIADKISEQITENSKNDHEIQLYEVMYEFVMLEDIDPALPTTSRILTEICLIGSDYEKITELVNKILNNNG